MTMSVIRTRSSRAIWRGAALAAGLTALLGAAVPAAQAQTAPQSRILTQQPAAQPVAQPVPDANVLARLVWSSMVAVDNANRTGNYSVLHALGTPQFQSVNSVDQLAASLAPLRDSRIDVGRAILMTPDYYLPPAIDAAGRLRLRGAFEFRPQSLRFDLMFENIGGGWRIAAISVAEMDFNAPR